MLFYFFHIIVTVLFILVAKISDYLSILEVGCYKIISL